MLDRRLIRLGRLNVSELDNVVYSSTLKNTVITLDENLDMQVSNIRYDIQTLTGLMENPRPGGQCKVCHQNSIIPFNHSTYPSFRYPRA